MNHMIGSLLVVIGTIWVGVSSCGLAIGFIGLWIVGLFWAVSSGILMIILWFIFGTTIIGFIFSIAAAPIALLGAGLLAAGEAMKNSDRT